MKIKKIVSTKYSFYDDGKQDVDDFGLGTLFTLSVTAASFFFFSLSEKKSRSV